MEKPDKVYFQLQTTNTEHESNEPIVLLKAAPKEYIGKSFGTILEYVSSEKEAFDTGLQRPASERRAMLSLREILDDKSIRKDLSLKLVGEDTGAAGVFVHLDEILADHYDAVKKDFSPNDDIGDDVTAPLVEMILTYRTTGGYVPF